MDNVESSFSIWHWHVSMYAGTEHNQTWLIYYLEQLCYHTNFRRDSPSITQKKLTKGFLKLIRYEDTDVMLVAINFPFSKLYEVTVNTCLIQVEYVPQTVLLHPPCALLVVA